ncbi:D-sedoheptulose-7-phosphate isomerase [Eubacterium ventriosum]|jgi:D-sedoheptulose 7-phosphate isomerase|uniref:D-sedoheptulose-7-phosphate isomerase n=1 Tax=Eubacterium ventriosum TaxID=39496 RepID=UPI00352002F1
MEYNDLIKTYLEQEIDILKRIDVSAVNEVLNLLEAGIKREATIYVFGNGGSAATASHFQNDFNKGVSEHIDKKFRFLCLNDNVATVMAVANDVGYEEVFRFQLQGKIKEGDILMAISGSGNSPNVINAVEYGKKQGCKVVGLTGYSGGRLKELSDISLHVPINSMQITEDVHMIFNHLMMSVFYKSMCGIDHIKN